MKLPARQLLRIAASAAAIALASALAFEVATRLVPLPPDLLRPAPATTTLVDSQGRMLASLATANARTQQPIALSAMGRWLPAVTIALEDRRFYEHAGIDWHSSAAALVRNLRGAAIVSGGSTITQQLIKLASRRTRRSWSAKLYENLAAVRVERMWSKDRILEEYLNRSHYGNRLIGPAAAARAYFHKAPAKLTLAEAIYLAGLPQAPSRFNPRRHADAAEAKHRRSVARLARAGLLDARRAARAKTPPLLSPAAPPQRFAPHFVDAVLQQHPNIRGGIVETTLDSELQRRAEKALELHLGKLAARGVSHGAIVILDTRNGAVRAMVGSRDYLAPGDGQINGAMIYRSCGSTLKPLLYLRAIDERLLTAASLLPDTPDAVRAEYIDYDPVNYDKRFWGPVRVREALGNSLNVPAVVTLSRIGARKMFRVLEECGLKFARPFSEYGAGLILGNAEVRLLDLTAAYTIFAGHSLAIEPRFLSSTPVRHRYLAAPSAAAIVADILADNSARQKTFGAFSPLAFENHRIPCKTGTSSGFRDAWTVGVTREHAVGVWVGNFDGRPMEEIAAVTGTAPLWREIIEHLLQRGDTPVPAPEAGAELTTREICRLTGLRPTSASPGVIKEWFRRGTEPATDASRYLREIGGVTRLILPPEYALWCCSLQNHLHAEPDSNSQFRIVSPSPNATFLIDPHLPSSQQALPLIAAGGSTEELVWTVDGKRIEPSNGRHFWRIAEGRHTVEVASSTDRASAEFSVE